MKQKVFIIAEAGVNHNGSLDLAKKLADVAAEARADAVKFQTFKAEKIVSKNTKMASYQTENLKTDESQLEMLKKLELSYADFKELKEYCNEIDILFLSTPDEKESLDFLADDLNIPLLKIGSSELTNLPYLRCIAQKNKPIILSTGMANLGEVESAIDVLVNSGTTRENLTILHCTTNYPCTYEEVNLNAMLTLKEAFKLPIGYSDHTLGIEVPVVAVALGATVIEKHFTLDKNMEGPDHRASLEPDALKAMVSAIRNIEKAMGDGIKQPSLSELKNKPIVRKSIVAAKDICKGEAFTEENLAVKRPGDGISPMRWDEISGRLAKRDFCADELIEI